ncbi:MAG: histidine kinase [Pyrinomonadaceae bacterium]|nr:histidine kinase [Pyrinomonadaceae bacterium]
MYSLNTASLINLLGFAVGVALYAMLFVMVLRHRKQDSKFDLLLLLTAVLGITWNAGELFTSVWQDFNGKPVPPLIKAVYFSALGFLPSVVVGSAENEKKNTRVLTIAAYALSSFAALLHFQSAFFSNFAPSNLALQILTFGSIALIIGLLVFNYRQKLENKTVWIFALLIFALSALHLSTKTEESSWYVELLAHQSSLPLVLAILFQDFRFAFADLFLKRALSLLLLALTAFSLYVFVAQPFQSLHTTHEANDALSTGILLLLWIATALFYPLLHKFSIWLVDKVILKRVSYEFLQNKIGRTLENIESIDLALDNVRDQIAEALTAKRSAWREVYESQSEANMPQVNYGRKAAEIFVPTNESPYYKISLKNFSGGRRLLSDEISMLEAVSLLTARKIDALRVTHERCEQEIREQEFAKLASEAQLTALRSQVNPHFLFNALTTIGYLIQTAPDKAFETLMRLTQLLRRVLRSTEEFCSLGEEISLIENYLDIERTRFEERLRVEIDVPKPLRKQQIPSLILQPLIENSIKHAISANKHGGKVSIVAAIEDTVYGSNLLLQVVDTGAGQNARDFTNGGGIGLENIRERLSAYYGANARFEIRTDVKKGTTAEVRIPLETAGVHSV